MPVTSYLVAIGSNRRHHRHGAPAGVVRAAMDALGGLGTVEARAPVMRTAAMGPAGRDFANAAVLLSTTLPPTALLRELKHLEVSFGRRRGRRWGQRVLDLDIILWSGGGWASPGLAIPHAAFAGRSFVLTPLVSIAPGWRDPRTALSVRQLAWRLTAPRPKPRERA